MKFKPGDLVRPTDSRSRFNGANLALVLRSARVLEGMLHGGFYLRWLKTGEQTWEYVDLFEKVSK